MIVVVMGVAGSGKSTIGTMLAAAFGCPFLEGDSLHDPANVEKMSRGIPLTDADRQPWLAAINARLRAASTRGEDLVAACSALTQASRSVLAAGVAIVWVYLKGSPDVLQSRLERRTGHYMKAGMLASQLDALEEPSDAIVADISQSPADIVQHILTELRQSPHRNDRPDHRR